MTSRLAVLAPGLALAVAVVLVYANSLSCPFIFDDPGGIADNKYIHKLSNLSDVLFRAPPDTAPAGRPVVSLSLAINYAIGGLDVRGYHMFNIAVHLASVLLLWAIVRRTLSHTRLNVRFGRSVSYLAFVVALVWAIHPLQTESVTYISQRTELLMGLFYLLTLYCAIRAWQPDSRRLWSVSAIVACAIGMGCKEAMVSAPLLVLLYDVTLVSSSLGEALRRHAKLYIGLAATWGLLAWLNMHAPRGLTCGAHLGLSRLDYLRTQADIIVWYLRLCFWPHPLVISYQDWPLARSFLPILPHGLLIVSLLALTAWGIRRRHPAALLGAWFFMILAPTSSFVPIVTELAAERRMYLPLVAVVIVVVVGFDALIRWARARLAMSARVVTVAVVIVVSLAAFALGYGTILRNRDYQTALGIWTDAVEKRPNNWAALQNLTSVLLEMGDIQAAIKHAGRTIELKPDFAEPYNSLGVAYGQLGELDQALTNSSRAIELKPSYAEAYNNRANVYSARREFDLAIADCTKAIELNPDYAEAYSNRAIAYASTRNYEPAIADCNKSIELKPDCVEAYLNRGSTYIAMREYDRALADYLVAVEINPKHARSYYNLAVAYYWHKQYDKAWANVAKCQHLGGQVKPQFIDALTKASSQPS